MWLISFASAVTKMILAHTFGQWYWKYDKKMIPSGTLTEGMQRTISCHLGTAALGSLIITLCRVAKRILNMAKKRKCRTPLDLILYLMVECVRCWLQAILELIEFVSNKAFVVCAIHGVSFWKGARTVSQLFLKDIILVAALSNVSYLIRFIKESCNNN